MSSETFTPDQGTQPEDTKRSAQPPALPGTVRELSEMSDDNLIQLAAIENGLSHTKLPPYERPILSHKLPVIDGDVKFEELRARRTYLMLIPLGQSMCLLDLRIPNPFKSAERRQAAELRRNFEEKRQYYTFILGLLRNHPELLDDEKCTDIVSTGWQAHQLRNKIQEFKALTPWKHHLTD
jgi:uncharacterized protein YjiS (DUF1127 family)